MKEMVQVNPDVLAQLRLRGLRTFHDFFAYDAGVTVGGHPRRNVARVAPAGLVGFLKRQHRVRWRERWTSWWAGFGWVSRTRREWQVLHLLRKRGIACPEPLAVGEQGHRAFLLVRGLRHALDLQSYLARHRRASGRVRRRLAQALAAHLADFHAAGFTHPDLYAKHVFVNPREHSFSFIDFQRTRLHRRVGWNRRWRDLAALDASLSDQLVSSGERLFFLRSYLRHAGAQPRRRRWRQALWAITRRTRHLLKRRKIRAMRHPAAPVLLRSRVEVRRVLWVTEPSLTSAAHELLPFETTRESS